MNTKNVCRPRKHVYVNVFFEKPITTSKYNIN